jgi:hypothetical protein
VNLANDGGDFGVVVCRVALVDQPRTLIPDSCTRDPGPRTLNPDLANDGGDFGVVVFGVRRVALVDQVVPCRQCIKYEHPLSECRVIRPYGRATPRSHVGSLPGRGKDEELFGMRRVALVDQVVPCDQHIKYVYTRTRHVSTQWASRDSLAEFRVERAQFV